MTNLCLLGEDLSLIPILKQSRIVPSVLSRRATFQNYSLWKLEKSSETPIFKTFFAFYDNLVPPRRGPTNDSRSKTAWHRPFWVERSCSKTITCGSFKIVRKAHFNFFCIYGKLVPPGQELTDDFRPKVAHKIRWRNAFWAKMPHSKLKPLEIVKIVRKLRILTFFAFMII